MMAYLSVAVGGALGAMLRYFASQVMPQAKGAFPLTTLLVNVAGSFMIGCLYVLIVERSGVNGYWRELLIVGFCGGLTTFSTFSIEALQLWQSGHIQTAILYIVLSVFFCIVAALISISLMRII